MSAGAMVPHSPFNGPRMVSDVPPRIPANQGVARLTIVPLPSSSFPIYNPATPTLGRLIPFPKSYSHLIFLIADAFSLPISAVSGLRLFLDVSAKDAHLDDPLRPSQPSQCPSKGGELFANSFPLLRDNDVLVLQLADHSNPPSPSHSHAPSHSPTSADSAVSPPSTPPPPLIGPPQPSITPPTSASPSPALPASSESAAGAVTPRVELTIVDATAPVGSPRVHRFAISSAQPLRKLRRRYAEIRRWNEGRVLFTVKRRRVDGVEVEVELNGNDTCAQQGLQAKQMLFAYQR